jgi:hypothetical protein
MVSSMAKRVEFNDPKYTTGFFKLYRDQDVALVAAHLATNTNLDSLTFDSCAIGDDASRALRDGLAGNASIDTLVVTNCNLTPRRMRRLLQGLCEQLEDAEEESELTDLKFTSCDLDDACVRHFSSLAISPPPSDLMLLTDLHSLDLSDNRIGDGGAVALGYLLDTSKKSKLTNLVLRNNRVGDRGAAALADRLRTNQQLDLLDLAHNKIGFKGGVSLANAFHETVEEKVQNAWLASVGLDDAANEPEIKKEGNKYLTQLYLGNNQIGAPGALAFGRVLDEAAISTTALATLDVSNNNIGNVGGRAMQKLAEQRTVGNLVVHGNQVGVCNCKHCVLVKDMAVDHWCFRVGVEEEAILAIDENGGNLTSANNVEVKESAEEEKKKREEKLRKEMKAKGKPMLLKEDSHEAKKREEALRKKKEEVRSMLLGESKNGKNHLENQLDNLMGTLKKKEVVVEEEEDFSDGEDGQRRKKEKEDAEKTEAALARLDAMLNEGSEKEKHGGGGTGSRPTTKERRTGSRQSSSRQSTATDSGRPRGDAEEVPPSSLSSSATDLFTPDEPPPPRKKSVKVGLDAGIQYQLSVKEMMAMSEQAFSASKVLDPEYINAETARGVLKVGRGRRGGHKKFGND